MEGSFLKGAQGSFQGFMVGIGQVFQLILLRTIWLLLCVGGSSKCSYTESPTGSLRDVRTSADFKRLGTVWRISKTGCPDICNLLRPLIKILCFYWFLVVIF